MNNVCPDDSKMIKTVPELSYDESTFGRMQKNDIFLKKSLLKNLILFGYLLLNRFTESAALKNGKDDHRTV